MTNPDLIVQMDRNVFIDLQSDYFYRFVQIRSKKKQGYKATLKRVKFLWYENSIWKSGNQKSRNRTQSRLFDYYTFQKSFFELIESSLFVFRNFRLSINWIS